MAIISMFYGIIISMYYLDNKQHNLPHIHVKYQDDEAVISIIDGQILEGTLKINKFKIENVIFNKQLPSQNNFNKKINEALNTYSQRKSILQ